MKVKIKVHTYARANKPNPEGKLPIYIRITVEGQRLEFSTKKFVLPAKWSSESAKMKGASEEACSLNNYLDLLRSKIFDIQMDLVHRNEPLTIEAFRNQLNGVEERPHFLIPIFEDHNDRIRTLVGQEYATGTLERYQTSLKHTREFIQWKYSLSDIAIKKIDHAFITDYEYYLRTVRKCANNTAVKYIKNFKKIVKLCMANGWLDKDPFVNYKSKVREVERELRSFVPVKVCSSERKKTHATTFENIRSMCIAA